MIRTKQRELLLEAIRSTDAHPTADELFQIVRRDLPAISLATVYRNLNYMVECGLVRRITVPGMPDRFDHYLEAHDHMICDCCGGIFDFSLPFDLGKELQQSLGCPISGYSLLVRSVCPSCREK